MALDSFMTIKFKVGSAFAWFNSKLINIEKRVPITSTGIGSGLDVESLVSQLVLAEVQPKETRLNRSEAAFQAEISSYGLIKGALSSFQSVSNTVSDPATYQAKSASVSDYTKMSASATNGVASGSYAITVSALAEKQSFCQYSILRLSLRLS